MSKAYLNSEFLDPRIQGIRNLNQVIDSNKQYYNSNPTITHKQIATWIIENQVLDIIWEAKKTHLQII